VHFAGERVFFSGLGLLCVNSTSQYDDIALLNFQRMQEENPQNLKNLAATFPPHQKNKHTNILDDLFWVGFWKGMGTKEKKNENKKKQKKTNWETYLGMGEGEKALQCIVF
jgi:tRNA G10  N-methylase Trm11